MNESRPQPQKKPRPLCPWVVGAIVLCLFAAGFSFWWPMYRVNRVLATVEGYEFLGESERWKSLFGNRFHPWYHHRLIVYQFAHSLTDKELEKLTKAPGVEYLYLNVADNSPQAVREWEISHSATRWFCLATGMKSRWTGSGGFLLCVYWRSSIMTFQQTAGEASRTRQSIKSL